MGAFEDFVNTELPRRVSVPELPVSGNLPPGKTLITTGIGLGVSAGDATPSDNLIYLPTNSDIGGHRAVATNDYAYYADPTITNSFCVGISVSAVSAGVDVPLQVSGKLQIPGMSWVVGGCVFVGTNGVLTQVVPTSGFIQKIGIACGSDCVLIEISQPIIL